jgi:hypothetical protein
MLKLVIKKITIIFVVTNNQNCNLFVLLNTMEIKHRDTLQMYTQTHKTVCACMHKTPTNFNLDSNNPTTLCE